MNMLVLSISHAQIISEGSQELPLAGARAAAMADAYIADFTDVAVMYRNPAGLPFLREFSFLGDVYYEQHNSSLTTVAGGTVWLSPVDAFTVSGIVSSLGYFPSDPNPHLQIVQYGADAAYGRIVAPGLSVGLEAGTRYLHSLAKDTWTSTWMVGVMYHPAPEVSYGAAFHDAAYGPPDNDPLISSMVEFHRRLQIGMTLRWPFSHRPSIFTLSLGNEKIFGQTGLLYKGGVEYYPVPYFAVRGGYIAGPGVAIPRYGAGIRADLFQLDYAIAPSLNDVVFQQLTLTIKFK